MAADAEGDHPNLLVGYTTVSVIDTAVVSLFFRFYSVQRSRAITLGLVAKRTTLTLEQLGVTRVAAPDVRVLSRGS